jgi:hypothetical protein
VYVYVYVYVYMYVYVYVYTNNCDCDCLAIGVIDVPLRTLTLYCQGPLSFSLASYSSPAHAPLLRF